MADERILSLTRKTRPLYPEAPVEGIYNALMKMRDNPQGHSNQSTSQGIKEHPFDMEAAINMKNFNVHHSTCIEAKRDATVGLGFEKDKVSETLDSLCDITFHQVSSDTNEDYWQVGNSYYEIIRLDPRVDSEIIGIHHAPAALVKKEITIDDAGIMDFHWVVQGDGIKKQIYANFGDIERVQALYPDDDVAELIAIPRPSSLDRWYGFPDWLSGVAMIELAQCMIQHEFDFFLNRGVPEFLAFFLGAKIDDPSWKSLIETMEAHIGLGNSSKSGMYNFQDPNLKIQLEKLGLAERQQGVFSEYFDTLAMGIVSAHRVPPLLAGIQIPGKLGATNELPNALMAFQVLMIGQAQASHKNILGMTLGNPKLNGGLSLVKEDFTYKKITDELNLDQMDTMSRMREPAAGGRDTSEGLKE